MRKWSIAVLCAFGLVPATAGASTAPPLTGTYKVTIAGQAPPLDGTWQLKFLPAGAVNILRNGHVVVVGRAVVAGGRVTFSDRSGSYACPPPDATGRYTYKLTGRRLTFRPIADKCTGRKLILTTKAFVK
jgi:outer membrane protein assembly factor BamB